MGRLPTTAMVLTGGGGRHIYFRPVSGLAPSAGKVGPGLDVKTGAGAYVLLPPSAHVSGRDYVDDLMFPLFDTLLATAPAWLVACAAAPSSPSSSINGTGPEDWGAQLAGAPEGQRHQVAARIAGHYLGRRLPVGEIEEILLGYAARCRPPFDAVDCRRIVRDLAAKDRAKPTAPTVEPQPGDGPVLVRLADVAPEEVDSLWQSRFARGKLSLVIGEPGDGKTSCGLDITARVSRAAAWPDAGAAPLGNTVLLADLAVFPKVVKAIIGIVLPTSWQPCMSASGLEVRPARLPLCHAGLGAAACGGRMRSRRQSARDPAPPGPPLGAIVVVEAVALPTLDQIVERPELAAPLSRPVLLTLLWKAMRAQDVCMVSLVTMECGPNGPRLEENKSLSVEEAAGLLGISEATLRDHGRRYTALRLTTGTRRVRYSARKVAAFQAGTLRLDAPAVDARPRRRPAEPVPVDGDERDRRRRA